MVLLSICIPTYNRAHFLDECLGSLFSQVDSALADKIEICVSDNHSEDETESIVAKWQSKKILKVVYYQHKENKGADANFLKVIEIASGEYCWYVGSDDYVVPGALQRFINAIHLCPVDIFIVRKQNYDYSLVSKQVTHDPVKNVLFRPINIHENPKECNNVLCALGYIGALAFSRLKWLEVLADSEHIRFVGSAYVHVYIIQRMIRNGSSIVCMKEVFIHCRNGNDSILLEHKAYGRFQIEINYCLITENLFGKRSSEASFVANHIIRNNMSPMLFEFKMQKSVSLKFLNLAFRNLRSRWNFYVWLLPIFLLPQPALFWIKKLYRVTVKRFIRV